LAQQLGVGRNALREALRSLEIAGIVRLQKGVKGGAFIREGDPSRMDQVVRDMLALGSISLDELSEARVHITVIAVRMVCERATKAELDALDGNIDRTEEMTAKGRYLDRVECSREFYNLLAIATHNHLISMMMHSVTEVLMQFVYARVSAGGAPQARLVSKRRAIVAAMREKDEATAIRLMAAHLHSVHRLLEKSALGIAAVRAAQVAGQDPRRLAA
jgi:DNA-binding FadR family transcriptional regulator